ncbi:hypothetical protein Tco_0857253, partial [Tanacetum coccineum]
FNFSNQKVNTVEVKAISAVGDMRETAVKPSDGPQRALKNKGVDSDNSRTGPQKKANHNAVKSSKAKNEGEKTNKDTGLKTNEEPIDQEDQSFLEELERLKRQEKQANDAAEALIKELLKKLREELLQFKLQKVWILIDLPYGKRAIGTKWVYRNKKDERGVVVRNKVKQKEDGIFISQDKYVVEILKKFDFMSVKTACTHMKTTKSHLLVACSKYSSTTSHLYAVKRIFRLISWQCKKQTIVATSTTEAE